MELNYFGKNKVIGITKLIDEKKENSDAVTEDSIKFKFGTFVLPENYDTNRLNIVLDHSFEADNLTNTIFIDHHLSETAHNLRYKSNSFMMMENFDDIYSVLFAMLNPDDRVYSNITVWIHSDIDGICSGIIMRDILNRIANNEEIYDKEHYMTNLRLAMILGNYGDIDEHAIVDLANYFDSEDEINIFNKKIKGWCSSISRFMKAVRQPVIHKYNKLFNMFLRELETDGFNDNAVDSKLVGTIYNDFLGGIANMSIVNTKSILFYFNNLAQNDIINRIVEIYNKTVERETTNYIDPTVPCFEMTIIFNGDKTKTKYKLLLVNSLFDIGRSVVWKYRSMYRMLTKKSFSSSEWYYKLTDWDKTKFNNIDTEHLMKNAVCYNLKLNKLSFDSENNSAYDIAKLFDGGGHGGMEDGNSLGSVEIKDITQFYNSFTIKEIY